MKNIQNFWCETIPNPICNFLGFFAEIWIFLQLLTDFCSFFHFLAEKYGFMYFSCRNCLVFCRNVQKVADWIIGFTHSE